MGRTLVCAPVAVIICFFSFEVPRSAGSIVNKIEIEMFLCVFFVKVGGGGGRNYF